MDKIAAYTVWLDNGGNVGVQCAKCHRTHWQSGDPNTDPLTGLPCGNCEQIAVNGFLQTENNVHKTKCGSNGAACYHRRTQAVQG